MATYSYTYEMIYSLSGQDWILVAGSPATGTLDDGDPGNDTFSGNEIIDGSDPYEGWGVIAGEVFVATAPNPAITMRLYGNPPAGYVPPGSFSNSLVNNSPFTVCFAAGTLIATREGERPVETLRVGDLVSTEEGRETPVLWLGRQTVHKRFTPRERFVPVRIRAGTLGAGLPYRDLVLTADHALILDGLAINAGALVNGRTITWEPLDALPEMVTYYHVETEAHEVIRANGALAETYIDYLSRRTFDNYDQYRALYGEDRVIPEMSRLRISSARLVPQHIRTRLALHEAA